MAQKIQFRRISTHVWRWLCGGNLVQVPPKKHSCISIRNHETDGGLENAKVFLSSQVGLLIFFEGGKRCADIAKCVRKTTAYNRYGRGERGASRFRPEAKNVMHTHYTLLLYGDALKARYAGSLPQFMVMCRGKWMLLFLAKGRLILRTIISFLKVCCGKISVQEILPVKSGLWFLALCVNVNIF